MTFFSPGEQFTLAVKGAPEDADITYSSADASVATVSDRGVITAMGSGTTTITVYVGGRDPLSCIVRCNLDSSAEAPDGSYSISHSDVTMSLMGEYFKLRLLDSNGDAVSGVSWSSGDSSICTVDASGVVTAAGSGTTTVSTTYGGSTYQCIVRCQSWIKAHCPKKIKTADRTASVRCFFQEFSVFRSLVSSVTMHQSPARPTSA